MVANLHCPFQQESSPFGQVDAKTLGVARCYVIKELRTVQQALESLRICVLLATSRSIVFRALQDPLLA